jgi:CxxC motif-containing protein
MEITCINCPMGCSLNVVMENGNVNNVAGAACKRGIAYAELECTNPTRIVTSTVPVRGGGLRRVPVKTGNAIPKSKIASCLHSLKGIELEVPVKIGDIVVKNVCGTGIDIVATRNVRAS